MTNFRKYNNACRNLATDIPYEKQWKITASMNLYEKLSPRIEGITFFTALGALYTLIAPHSQVQLYADATALAEVTKEQLSIARLFLPEDMARLINAYLVNNAYYERLELNFWNAVPHDIFTYTITTCEDECDFLFEFLMDDSESCCSFLIHSKVNDIAGLLSLLFKSKFACSTLPLELEPR